MKRLIIPPNSKINNITVSSSVENTIEISDNATIKNIFIQPQPSQYYKSVVILKGNFKNCNIYIQESCKIIFDNFTISTTLKLNAPNKFIKFVANPLTPTNISISSPCSVSHYTITPHTNLDFIINYNDINSHIYLTGSNFLENIHILSPCTATFQGNISNILIQSPCNITLSEETTVSNLNTISPINLYGYKESLELIPDNTLINKEETIFLVDFFNNIGTLSKSLNNYSTGKYKLSLYVNLGDEKIEIPNNLSFLIEN